MKAALNIFLATTISIFLYACTQNSLEKSNINKNSQADSNSLSNARIQISEVLDSFNIAAANADFENYFKYLTDDAVFIGTDATEVWNKDNFMIWAKPYFDNGNAWEFQSIDRHIYFDKTGNIAWFDELLDTQMKICRGSGVLTKQGNDWKIQQYVLSMTIPNSLIDTVINLKSVHDDEFLKNL
ncbi:MAG TPA: nuclear transport factor 2 family protein [Bacteroidales bacterium]